MYVHQGTVRTSGCTVLGVALDTNIARMLGGNLCFLVSFMSSELQTER